MTSSSPMFPTPPVSPVSSTSPASPADILGRPNASIATETADPLTSLPKAELHLHIEGTLEPDLALELARRNSVALPWTDLATLRRQYQFDDLQSFLDLYYRLMAVLRTADDFRDLMLAYLERASHDGVLHSEIFFDPQVHMGNGLSIDTVMDGLLEGMRLGRERWGITSSLILCIVRDLPLESAELTLDAVEHRVEDLVGIGLDSAEVGYPPSLFTGVFDRAGRMGLHRVAHAGEEGPAGYVSQALDLLHVERIDHGVHSADDAGVVRRLAADDIPLTMCPLSNTRLHVASSVRDLPIAALLDAGVKVTLNSDDPAYFGGYIADNYRALERDAGIALKDLATMARNSIEASFVDEDERRRMLAMHDAWLRLRLHDDDEGKAKVAGMKGTDADGTNTEGTDAEGTNTGA